MQKQHMERTILGVSFSSRMLGLAVLQSGSLIAYSTKLFKEAWSPAKMDRILTSLTSAIAEYAIEDMVLSIPPIHFQGEPFQALWPEVVALGRNKELKVTSFTQDTLQALCGSDERMTRKSLMDSLASIYPELILFYKIESRSKNKYYYKMFEAIAVATLFVTQV